MFFIQNTDIVAMATKTIDYYLDSCYIIYRFLISSNSFLIFFYCFQEWSEWRTVIFYLVWSIEFFVFFIYCNTGTFCSIFSLPALKTHSIRALIARELNLHCKNFHNKNSFYQFRNVIIVFRLVILFLCG